MPEWIRSTARHLIGESRWCGPTSIASGSRRGRARALVEHAAERVRSDFAAFIDISDATEEGGIRVVESVATVIDPIGDRDEAPDIVAELANI